MLIYVRLYNFYKQSTTKMARVVTVSISAATGFALVVVIFSIFMIRMCMSKRQNNGRYRPEKTETYINHNKPNGYKISEEILRSNGYVPSNLPLSELKPPEKLPERLI